MTGQQATEGAKNEKMKVLTEIEAKELLKQAGIDVVDTQLAASKEAALSISQQIGFPVVLKIVSTEVLHKTDAGGVKLGLETAAQVEAAYDDIMKSIKKNFPMPGFRGYRCKIWHVPG